MTLSADVVAHALACRGELQLAIRRSARPWLSPGQRAPRHAEACATQPVGFWKMTMLFFNIP